MCHASGQTDRQAGRQTDRQKKLIQLTVAFPNFAIAPKKRIILDVGWLTKDFREGKVLPCRHYEGGFRV